MKNAIKRTERWGKEHLGQCFGQGTWLETWPEGEKREWKAEAVGKG